MALNITIPSNRQMKSNIWKTLLTASNQEVLEGMYFYYSALSLCKALTHLYKGPCNNIDYTHVAGIYAALSPLNSWESNVSDVLSILRHGDSSVVNTTKPNKVKAIQIYSGKPSLQVLRGRKVRSFYKNIVLPNAECIPVDRHLFNTSFGITLDKRTLSSVASNMSLYSKIEDIYLELGEREGIGCKLASIIWFVSRGFGRKQVRRLYGESRAVCCGHPTHVYGPFSRRRYVCPRCGRSRSQRPLKSLKYPQIGTVDGYPIYDTPRPTVKLGNHPLAYSNGRQYLHRYLVMRDIGKLPSDYHVHHVDSDMLNNKVSNLVVLPAKEHGILHGTSKAVYNFRDDLGRFTSLEPDSKEIESNVCELDSSTYEEPNLSPF
jgi:hypothetical protein